MPHRSRKLPLRRNPAIRCAPRHHHPHRRSLDHHAPERALERTPHTWPGWRWEFWNDAYTQQATRARDTFTLPPADIDSWLITLAGHFAAHPGSDPTQTAHDLINLLTHDGHHVTAGARLYDHQHTTPKPEEREHVATAIRALTTRL